MALRNMHDRYPTSYYAPKALFELARLQESMGHNFLDDLFGVKRKSSFQMAAQTLQQLLKEYPESEEAPSALIELGRLYDPDHLNQPRKSNQFYKIISVKFPSTSCPVLYYMARNFEVLGEEETARELYRKFLEDNSAGEEARIARKKVKELP